MINGIVLFELKFKLQSFDRKYCFGVIAVYGFGCQCSGVRKTQRIAHRKQMAEDKG
jgi:hypothetical protein